VARDACSRPSGPTSPRRELQNRPDSHSSPRSGGELSFGRDISLRREGLA